MNPEIAKISIKHQIEIEGKDLIFANKNEKTKTITNKVIGSTNISQCKYKINK
jgi:hypothetical protein